MKPPTLRDLEATASRRGLLLRLQIRQWGPLTTLRVGVARRCEQGLVLLGELKGWALPSADGLRLDTMRVQGNYTAGVGALIWSATWAWALEATPCRCGKILVIRDNDVQHRRLVRYFRRLGFEPLRELGAGPLDLAPRLIWGGSGLLMRGDCAVGLARATRQLGADWADVHVSFDGAGGPLAMHRPNLEPGHGQPIGTGAKNS